MSNYFSIFIVFHIIFMIGLTNVGAAEASFDEAALKPYKCRLVDEDSGFGFSITKISILPPTSGDTTEKDVMGCIDAQQSAKERNMNSEYNYRSDINSYTKQMSLTYQITLFYYKVSLFCKWKKNIIDNNRILAERIGRFINNTYDRKRQVVIYDDIIYWFPDDLHEKMPTNAQACRELLGSEQGFVGFVSDYVVPIKRVMDSKNPSSEMRANLKTNYDLH